MTWDEVRDEERMIDEQLRQEQERDSLLARGARQLEITAKLLADAAGTETDLILDDPPDVRPDSDDPAARQAFALREEAKASERLAAEQRAAVMWMTP